MQSPPAFQQFSLASQLKHEQFILIFDIMKHTFDITKHTRMKTIYKIMVILKQCMLQ